MRPGHQEGPVQKHRACWRLHDVRGHPGANVEGDLGASRLAHEARSGVARRPEALVLAGRRHSLANAEV